MAAVRREVMASPSARNDYLRGVVLLDQERPGMTTRQAEQALRRLGVPLRMSGIDQALSTYDLFVLWHVAAMSLSLPPGNAAHSGPIFLPWHRMYLIRLEQELQRVLGKSDFGLPYWDWAAHGELPVHEQWRTALWTSDHLGEARGDVVSGEARHVRVRLWQHPATGVLHSIPGRPVQRACGMEPNWPNLPRSRDVTWCLDQMDYDRPDWSDNVPGGHRNRLEGWVNGPQLHNRVHVWIGGDMSPGTSPNDPAFFLNHCQVDRIWEAWMADHVLDYRPQANEGPAGHRVDDAMFAMIGDPMTPADVIDASAWYTYDSLAVT